MDTALGDKAGGASGVLTHIGLLRFAGAEAAAFLQGQVSNDTRALQDGRAVLAAYSSPQGRVVAVLRLLPHSSGILALMPREIVLPTLERMRKYVMRAKVRLEDVSDEFAAAGVYRTAAVPDAAAATNGGYVEHDGVGSAALGHDSARAWLVGPRADVLARVSPAAGDGAESAWRLADIRAGLPQVYAATREMFVAQMLNLDLLDGISFTKGCFTGQEIIARTQHLGRIKRRMSRLRLPPGTWAIGQPIALVDGRSGRLTELAADGGSIEALAVLNLETSVEGGADAEAAADRVAAIELPLPYSFGPN